MDFFHGVQVAIMFALMTNILQFAWWKVKGKKHLSFCARNRPVFVLVVATILVCFQPVCMLVIGSWDTIDNFFFDGSDANHFCSGVPGKFSCESGACLSSGFDGPGLVKNHGANAVPELAYLWENTGCNEIPRANWTASPDGTLGEGEILNSVYGDGLVQTAAESFFTACTDSSSPFHQLCGVTDPKKCVNLWGDGTPKTMDKNVVQINAAADASGLFDVCFPYSKQFPVDAKDPIPLCVCAMNSNALVPNTSVGWCIQIFGTYMGFIFMFCGVFEATQLHVKIMKKWRKLRGNM